MFWNLFEPYKKQIMMIEFLPYFAGLITILFSVGFAYALMEDDDDRDSI
jgi:hypothetical protein